MKSDVLIIGAGVAGLSAAGYLSSLGYDCLLVEKGLFPGGHAAHLSCKATGSCARCNACLLEESLTDAEEGHSRLAVQTEVTGLKAEEGGYVAALRREATLLDPVKCVDCGLCYDACPERGLALQKSPAPAWGPRYGLEARHCLQVRGQDCRACVDACPAGAIDFGAEAVEEEIRVRTVVYAGGFVPFDAAGKPRYGYGRLTDVVTALDLDRQLRTTGRVTRPSDGMPPDRVAFIQCVGSRDRSIGRDYCSRVCCGYALRIARLIRHRRPETDISFFYMDLQNAGRSFGTYLNEVKAEIELLQGVPGEINLSPKGTLLVPHMDPEDGRKNVREFDLVVLSIGLGPPDGALVSALGFDTDQDGFPLSRPDQGLFVAGAASGPMSVAESRALALGTAARAHRYLKR